LKNFLDIDEQIEANIKALEFYYNNYQKAQNKLSLLVLIYTIISVYIVQLIKFPFDKSIKTECIIFIVFIILMLAFLSLLVLSVYHTFQMLKPENVAYLNNPKYFYNDVKKEYQKSLETTKKDIINAYLKVSYLNELENALEQNINLYETKSRHFYNAFIKLLPALIIYILCSGIVIFNSEEDKEIKIKKYKEIIQYSDSIKKQPKIINYVKRKTKKNSEGLNKNRSFKSNQNSAKIG
jgi:hypothetical protein